jgi:hypothetical protein
MASLTQLKELRLDARFDAEFDDGTVLPAQLQRLLLTFSGTGRHSGLRPVLQLQQLQHLELTFPEDLAQLWARYVCLPLLEDALTRLALLPALQHVKLEYLATPGGLVTDDLLAAGTARAWGQMPQLRELRLRFKVSAAHTWQMEQILSGTGPV